MFFISCQQATLLIEQQAEATLSLVSRNSLKLHLLYCPYCSRYAQQSAQINQVLMAAAARRQTSQPGLSEQARARLHRRLLDADRGSGKNT